jgi:hypothetical protein
VSDPAVAVTVAGRSGRAVPVAWALISLTLICVAWVDAPRLGLYYDEAFLAQQARDFVEPGRPSTHPGSVRSVEIAGRPFPTHNAAYLGALKSQLVMPAFAVFGATPRVLRVATCATGLLALLFAMLWLEALFGRAVAVLCGVLVASDPAFFFFSQYEWGPFTTNLLCRSLGAWALWQAWQRRGSASTIAAGGAGLVFGLGVYSRADFALILAAAGIALLVFRRDLVVTALRERRAATIVGAALLMLASAPMWTSLPALLSTGEAIADRGDLAERAALLRSTLDGTRFHSLMEVGGVFERAFDVPDAAATIAVEPTALLGCAFGAFVLLSVETLRRRRQEGPSPELAIRGWLLATTAGVTLAMLALPGAVRAHHQLGVLPLWHAIIAVAVVDLFARAWRSPRHALLARTALAAAVGFVVAGQLASIVQTRRFIEETGGRGRWSQALTLFAQDFDRPGAEAVSLDWGFHEPLLFLTRDAQLGEAIWALPASLRAGRPWRHGGDADTVYLVHDETYDLFGIGPRLLAFAEAQSAGAETPGSPRVETEVHLDGQGQPAFYSVRVAGPHVLVFDGRFRLE